MRSCRAPRHGSTSLLTFFAIHGYPYRPLSSSFLGVILRILYGNPNKELLRGLWLKQPSFLCRDWEDGTVWDSSAAHAKPQKLRRRCASRTQRAINDGKHWH